MLIYAPNFSRDSVKYARSWGWYELLKTMLKFVIPVIWDGHKNMSSLQNPIPQKQFCRNKINLPTKVQVLSSISEAHVALVPNHSNGICWTSEEYSRHERQLSSVLRDGNPTTCLSIFTATTNSYFMMIPISPIYRTSFGWEDFVLTRHIHNVFHCCTSLYIH